MMATEAVLGDKGKIPEFLSSTMDSFATSVAVAVLCAVAWARVAVIFGG